MCPLLIVGMIFRNACINRAGIKCTILMHTDRRQRPRSRGDKPVSARDSRTIATKSMPDTPFRSSMIRKKPAPHLDSGVDTGFHVQQSHSCSNEATSDPDLPDRDQGDQ